MMNNPFATVVVMNNPFATVIMMNNPFATVVVMNNLFAISVARLRSLYLATEFYHSSQSHVSYIIITVAF